MTFKINCYFFKFYNSLPAYNNFLTFSLYLNAI